MARQIFAAEISHEDAPLAVREQLSANDSVVKNHLQKLSSQVDEVFILSSCNRFTVYALSENINPLVDFFSQYTALQGYVQFYYNSEESITHLFAVASGLLSPIKGDHLILEQLKQAHACALQVNSVGITLDNLLCQAIAIGKRVRTETGIDKFCSSVVDAGIELLYNRLESLHNKKFLIIGTGKIARLTLKYLYNEGIQNVKIVSKDHQRAQQLAELYYVSAAPIESLHEEVRAADVVIGGTHYEVSLFSNSFLSGFYEHDKMWFILDFGMPRNFNHKLADHSCIELYNLDDMKRLHKSPLDAFGGIEAAWTIVMREAKLFMEILVQLEFSPALAAYWNRLLYVKNCELNVLLPKLDERLTAVDIEQIKKQTQKLVRNVSGHVSTKHMINNMKADNPIQWLINMKDFDQVRLNVSLN